MKFETLTAAMLLLTVNCQERGYSRAKPGSSASPSALALSAVPSVTSQPAELASAPAMTAERELALRSEQLAASGPASPELIAKFQATAAAWRPLAKRWKIAFADPHCFVRGCALSMSSPDLGSLEQMTLALAHEPSFMAWDGGKFRSGPLSVPAKPKQMQATWIFFVD